jgi:hypothetical protein
MDNAFYTKTGKHLSDLQRGIIKGTLQQMRYSDIAGTYGCTAGHAKDVGYELLKMLSDIFDEPLNKKSLKSALERKGNLNIWGNRFGNSTIISYIHLCPDRSTIPTENSEGESSHLEDVEHQVKIEAMAKLRQIGLNDEQIQQILEIGLMNVNSLECEE